MKRALIITLLLLAILPVALAGERHNINITNTPVFYTLPAGDIAVYNYTVKQYKEPQDVQGKQYFEFELASEQQALFIDEIYSDAKGIHHAKIVNFIQGSKLPYYHDVTSTDTILLDYEFDELTDVVLQIIAVQPDKGVTFMLLPQDTTGEKPNPHVFTSEKTTLPVEGRGTITGAATGITAEKSLWIGGAALVLVVLLLLINHRGIRRLLVHRRNEKLRTADQPAVPEEKAPEE